MSAQPSGWHSPARSDRLAARSGPRRPINAYQVELWQELCARQAHEMRQIRRRIWQLFQLRGGEHLKALLGLLSSVVAYVVVSIQASETYEGILTEDE